MSVASGGAVLVQSTTADCGLGWDRIGTVRWIGDEMEFDECCVPG
jgi:hypothetical protein